MLAWIGWGITFLSGLYLLVLIGRMILDWTLVLRRDFRPTGLVAVIANFIVMLTDPPLNWLGRFLRPVQLGGGVALDLGYILLFVGVLVIQRIGGVLQAM